VCYLSIPEHPFYQQTLGWRPGDYPNAMRIGRQTVSLPITAKLPDNDIGRAINCIFAGSKKPYYIQIVMQIHFRLRQNLCPSNSMAYKKMSETQDQSCCWSH
jgi:hypothetical protein